jgi:hypothetical protein
MWSHAELVADLAEQLSSSNRHIAGEVRFGSAWVDGAPIPDVVRIAKSFAHPSIAIYEVKANRPDFLGELRSEKWRVYLPMCTQFFFATPKGQVVENEREIPDQAGWIVRGPASWRVVRSARACEPNAEEVWRGILALAMRENQRAGRLEVEIAALRKLKHRHNVLANSKMWQRVYRVEATIRERAQYRADAKAMVAAVREATGTPNAWWNWREALAALVRDRTDQAGPLRRARERLAQAVTELDSEIEAQKVEDDVESKLEAS